jgi:predicted dehydrogenase
MPMLERLLVVGLGSIGRRHARLARQLVPDVEIVALRHRECPGVDDPGIDRCVTSVDEALRLRPQAAVVANPASHHLDVALRLADAGVHLLVEKPIASASRGVAELIDLARARGAVLMTGYNLRFLPSLRRFRELLNEKRVGRALSVRAEIGQFLPTWRRGSDYRQTVSAQASLGGGVLLELSHDIDYLRWLFGEVRWVSAILSRQSALEIDVEDSAHLVLSFSPEIGGVPVLATLNMDFVRHDTTRSCTVIGDTGSLRWNAITGMVDVFEAGGTSWQTLYEHAPHRDESYLAEWQQFLACISHGGQPTVSGADGLAVLRVIEAARHSSTTCAVARLDRIEGSLESIREVE